MDWSKIACLSLAILSVACTKAPIDDCNAVSITFDNAGISSSKTALNAGRTAIAWQQGDAVSLLNSVNKVNERIEYNTSGTSVAGNVPSSAQTLYAVYPYSEDFSSGAASVSISIRNDQTQTAAGVLNGTCYPMTGSGNVVDRSATLDFSPVASSLALNIYKTGLTENETVTSVKVFPTVNKDFAGKCEFDLTSGPAKFTKGDSSDTLSLSLSTPLSLKSAKPESPVTSADQLYVTLAKQSYSYVEFRIRTNRFLYVCKSNAVPIDLSSSDFKVLNINLEKGEIELVCSGLSSEGMEENRYEAITGSFENPVPLSPLPDGNTVDIIPDFSMVGYRYGDEDIPNYSKVVNVPAPTSGDFTKTLQDIIDAASSNSVIQFQAGTYILNGIIFLDRKNIILRGAGTASNPTTTLRAAGTVKRPLLFIGTTIPGSDKGRDVLEKEETVYDEDGTESKITSLVVSTTSRVTGYGSSITEEYTPVGRSYVTVKSSSMFSKGDRVVVRRCSNKQWISDIKMDCIAQNAKGTVKQWQPYEYQLDFERVVTAVEGNRLYLDAPMVQSIDSYYGGGMVFQCSWDRVSGVGVENLILISDYSGDVDEQHAWTAIHVNSAEHCWIQGVQSKYFSYSLVDLAEGARCITVSNCKSSDPKSVVTGSRRYAFHIHGGSLCLVRDCTCDKDRHGFVTGVRDCGPNAFVNCKATNSLSDLGPHHRWATGCLYDCVTTDGALDVQDGGNFGSGHGWQGANFVFWNCDAETSTTKYGGVVCQRPWMGANAPRRSATNYAVGCNKKGTGRGYTDSLGPRENGEWASVGKKVSLPCAAPSSEPWWPTFKTTSFTNPKSLYQCQWEERHNNGQLMNGIR